MAGKKISLHTRISYYNVVKVLKKLYHINDGVEVIEHFAKDTGKKYRKNESAVLRNFAKKVDSLPKFPDYTIKKAIKSVTGYEIDMDTYR